MNDNSKYTEGEIGRVRMVKDFLPAPADLVARLKKDVDGRDIGERSDAVLRAAMPGHDDGED